MREIISEFRGTDGEHELKQTKRRERAGHIRLANAFGKSSKRFSDELSPVEKYDLYALRLRKVSYGLDNIQEFIDASDLKADPTNLGIFISAAINKVMGEDDMLELNARFFELNWLGMRLPRGTLILNGDLGIGAAYLMLGGEFTVKGNAGMRAGEGISGGNFLVIGNVGSFAAKDMTGGAMITDGNAGPEAANHMGGNAVFLIHGNAGVRAGAFMNGGTLLIGGEPDEMLGEDRTGGRIFVKGREIYLGEH